MWRYLVSTTLSTYIGESPWKSAKNHVKPHCRGLDYARENIVE